MCSLPQLMDWDLLNCQWLNMVGTNRLWSFSFLGGLSTCSWWECSIGDGRNNIVGRIWIFWFKGKQWLLHQHLGGLLDIDFFLIFQVGDKHLQIIYSLDFNKAQRGQALTLSTYSVPATVAGSSIERAQVFQSDNPKWEFKFCILGV